MGEFIDFYGCSVKADERNSQSPLAEMLEVFKLLRPNASSQPLIRIGGNRDGSYLVPDDVLGITACFSPGVSNTKSFEDFLVDKYGIECHMCDYSSDLHRFKTPLKEGKQTFLKKWLEVESGGDNISLDDWVKEKSPSGDLLLQIDIEGAEYRNLLSVSDRTLLRFRIIVIEVHFLGQMTNAAILRGVLAPFFEKLSRFFTNIHAHPNNCCGEFVIPGTSIRVPNLLELTYLRNDRLDSPRYPPMLPHPLDISRNVPTKPPLFLGEEWLDNGRSLESRIRMVEDRLEEHESRPTVSAEAVKMILRSLDTLSEKVRALADQPLNRTMSLREVAAGCPYVLSTAYGKMKTSGLVEKRGNFFFHTDFGTNQFIKIDLGNVFKIVTISITNRLDMCFDRARVLFAILSIDNELNREEFFHFNTDNEFLIGKKAECQISIPVSQARFVTLISPVETALHFSDLKIFAVD